MLIIDFILAFVFACLMISLFVSWMIEIWANQQNKKGELLKKMLGNLLDDEDSSVWVKKLYEHPMIKSLSYNNKRLTSYIPPSLFSDAITDLVLAENRNPDDSNETDKEIHEKVRAALEKMPENNLKITLRILLNKTPNTEQFLKEIENWYNEYMLRVNHAYKRLLRAPLWILGFIVALAFNIDSVRIASDLWTNTPLRANLSEMAIKFSEDEKLPKTKDLTEDFFIKYKEKMQLPIGWNYEKNYICEKQIANPQFPDCIYYLIKFIGFFITGVIASFGAQFWYDALQKIVGLKKEVKMKTQ